MKGTFYSIDYVRTDDGLKFVEINTDTMSHFGFISNNYVDWNPLMTYINNNSIDTVEVIYKPKLQQDIVNHLSQSIIDSASAVTTFTKHEENTDTIYPTTVTDASNKFILRMAYDENAILDSTYAKNDLNSLKLFGEYSSSDECVPFYYSSSVDGVEDTLGVYTTNPYRYPDFVKKAKQSTHGVTFHKAAEYSGSIDSSVDTDRVTEYLKSVDYTESYTQKFTYGTGSVVDGHMTSVRYYGIVYGGTLDNMTIGVCSAKSILPIPTESDLNWPSSSHWDIPLKHWYGYSTSTPKSANEKRGVFETEQVISSSNALLAVDSVQDGNVLKSFYIPNVTDDDDLVQHHITIEVAGPNLPVGSYETASVVQGEPIEVPMKFPSVVELRISGSDVSNYFSDDVTTLIYNSSSNVFKFKPIRAIDKTDDYLFDADSNKLEIETLKFHILESNTGSFYEYDVETEDNFIIANSSDGTLTSSMYTIVHNRKY